MSIWDTVQQSCEAAFYSETDWERLRLELWFANHTMASGRPSGQAWIAIQRGLNELLLSPAVGAADVVSRQRRARRRVWRIWHAHWVASAIAWTGSCSS